MIYLFKMLIFDFAYLYILYILFGERFKIIE